MASKVSLQEFVLKKQGNSKQGLAVSQKNLFLLFLIVTVVVFDVSVSVLFHINFPFTLRFSLCF